MDDSRDMPGGEPEQPEEETAPSAAELEAAGQSALFGGDDLAPAPADQQQAMDEPPAAQEPVLPPLARPAPAAQPYRVLARKYRPQTFAELIGQEAMVQTLANAIKRDRLAHAFLMTGVRGVGKTSTARLITKALNCIGPDGAGGPTIDPCGQCEPCVAIAEGRHIDVIEMDAASHNGIDDVRAMTDAVRYAAVSARYKIYIVDEVHMMTKPAFNALLKTLEEPPAHVKFLFATTEVEKLPVTVLSRCQRFDLKRIAAPMLADHFAHVCASEQIEAEHEALAMIAAAAEGSVRDGLSILDQAIAHADMGGDGQVTAAQVQDMIGLADKGARRRLFAAVMEGDGAALLDLVEQQFALGVEPNALMRSMMELVHRITVAQIAGRLEDAVSAEDREAIEGWASALAPGQLHRLWQLLLKGHDEVKGAPDPLVAAQMALLRVMHASDMPDPGTLARRIEELASRPAAAPAQPGGGEGAGATSAARPAPEWAALVERIEHHHIGLGSRLRMQVGVVELTHGSLRYAQAPEFRDDLEAELRKALLELTGDRWTIERCDHPAMPTLVEQAEARSRAAEAAIRDDPLVAATLAAFPGAELITDESRASAGGGRNWSNRR